jgi:hypothetical protein
MPDQPNPPAPGPEITTAPPAGTDQSLRFLLELHSVGNHATRAQCYRHLSRLVPQSINARAVDLNALLRALDDDGYVEVTWRTEYRREFKDVTLLPAGLDRLRQDNFHTCTEHCSPL